MNCKERSDKSARPKCVDQAAKPEKKQNSGDRVQQNVCEMMTAGFQIEDLAIKHVRNQGERVPIVRLRVDESFADGVPTQSAANQRIAVDVGLIVIVNEVVPERLTEHAPNQDNEHPANCDVAQR